MWRLAWPTMLQNVIAGLQGIIDHAMVGLFVGYTANAAIGVSWQIVLVVVVFTSSLFTGMGVLVARFAGANEPDKVNRVVYQAFLTALFVGGILAAVGYVASPALLRLVNAAPEVARRGAAVPARDVRRHHGHDDVLHAERRLPRGWRPENAAAPGAGDDGVDDRLQRRADPHDGHAGRGDRHDRQQLASCRCTACGT